jgi:hypothetical protein
MVELSAIGQGRGRGVVVVEMELRRYFPDDVTHEAMAELGLDDKGFTCGLPDAHTANATYVTASVTGTMVRCSYDLMPDAEPPPDLVVLSQASGGRAKVEERIRAFWTSRTTETLTVLRVTYHLSAQVWDSNLFHPGNRRFGTGKQKVAKLESAFWSLDGFESVFAVLIKHPDKRGGGYEFAVQSPREIGGWPDVVAWEAAIWQDVHSLLIRREA